MIQIIIPGQPQGKVGHDRLKAIRRLESRISLSGGCFVPGFVRDKKGYVRFRFSGRMVSAHRFVYETFVGPIADGYTIDHLCRNTSCCNPEHLEQVTVNENIRRGTQGEKQAKKSHCIRGHEFTPENTYRPPNKNERLCRECMRMHGRKNDAIRRQKRRETRD